MTDNTALKALADNGVSVWLDDLSRQRIQSGNLQELIDTKGIVGVTTNPSIFQLALSEGSAYDEQVSRLGAEGTTVEDAAFAMTTEDVRNACDILRPVYDATDGVDGRVSIEVDPRLAHETAATVQQAKALWAAVDRPNVFVKIPATVEGLPAISQVLSQGISVNVTLIFSLDRYRGVMNAFLTGLEQAREAGLDLSRIDSVASFFVSRVDTEVDKRLDAIGTEDALSLKGQAGVANARLAYQAYEEVFSTPRWKNLADDGAHVQRPLWASTGVKNPEYPDTLYVTELVAPNTVNTMPEKTLEAVLDHGEIQGDTITGNYQEAGELLDALERLGISYADVTAQLEREGVQKFVASWGELLQGVRAELDKVDRVSSLGVVASGPAADAIAAQVPALAEERFASRLFEQDATLWGPDAESEAAVRLSWVGLPRSSRPLVGEVAALREQLPLRGRGPRRPVRDGRVLAGAGGHLCDRRRRPGRPRLLRTRHGALGPRGPRPHRRGGVEQVRLHGGDRLPATGLPGSLRRRRHRPHGAHRRRDRPRQPAGRASHGTAATASSTPTPTWAAATPR